MSMVYCHKHDRHRDTDFDTDCAECVEDVGTLRECVDLQNQIMLKAGRTGAYIYPTKTHSADLDFLRRLENELKFAEAELEKG